MVALSTPDALRDYLEIPYAELDDERATIILEKISGVVLAHLGRTKLEVDTYTAEIDGTGTPLLLLPYYPVVSVALTERISETVLVDDVDYEWTKNGKIWRLPRGRRWLDRARAYVAVFGSGFPAGDPAHDAVEAVVLRLCARAVTNPEGLATEGTAGYNAGFAFDDTRLPTVSAPDRRDLQPFRIDP